MVVEGSGAVYPCDFFCLDAYKLGTVQNDTLQSLLTGEKVRAFITDGWQIPAECQQCKWVHLCRGGCKRDRNVADKVRRSYYCKALQKFLPTQNRACTKWFALFKCTAEKETNIYWTRKINAGSCFSLPLS